MDYIKENGITVCKEEDAEIIEYKQTQKYIFITIQNGCPYFQIVDGLGDVQLDGVVVDGSEIIIGNHKFTITHEVKG